MMRLLGGDMLRGIRDRYYSALENERPWENGQLWTASRGSSGAAVIAQAPRYEADRVEIRSSKWGVPLDPVFTSLGHQLDAHTLGLWRFDLGLPDTRQPVVSDSNGLAWTIAEAVPTICSFSPIPGAYARRFITGASGSGIKSSLTRPTSTAYQNMFYGSWTVEAFVRIDTSAGITSWIASHSGASSSETLADNLIFGFAMLSTGFLSALWEFGAGTNQTVTSTIAAPSLGVWHYIAISKDSGTKFVKFYVDGALVDTVAYASDPTGGTAGSFAIGSGEPGTTVSNGFDGALRTIAFSNVVRNQAWISDNYARMSTRGDLARDGSTQTLLEFFDPPAAVDSSPNEFHLVSSGAGSTNITGPSASLVLGDPGRARSFNNCLMSTRYSELVRSAMFANFTVEGWIQLMAPTPSNSAIVFTFGGDTFLETEINNVCEAGVTVLGELFFMCEYNAGLNAGATSAPGTIVIGQRYHVAFRKTMTAGTWTAAIFLNGVKIKEEINLPNYTDAGNDPESSILSIGGGTQAVFFGFIDDVRLSDVARTDDEIKGNFQRGNTTLVATNFTHTAVGDLAVAPLTARWTPVVINFTVPPGQSVVLLAKIGENSVLTMVAYSDELGGIQPLFSVKSVVTITGTLQSGRTFQASILPNGGWIREQVTIVPYVAFEVT